MRSTLWHGCTGTERNGLVKRIALLVWVLVLTVRPAIGKPVPPLVPMPLLTDGQYGYEQVFEEPGVSQSELFSRAQVWITSSYKSGPTVTQLSDKDSGTLMVKGTFAVEHPTCGPNDVVTVSSTLTISVKDGRWRLRWADFSTDYGDKVFGCKGHTTPTEINIARRWGREVVNHTTETTVVIIETLKKAMAQPIANW